MEVLSFMDEDEGITMNAFSDQVFPEKISFCLVGSFFRIGRLAHIMKDCMADIWQQGKGVTIKDLEQGRFCFQFYHQLDLDIVTKGGPWSFDNYMLVLERLTPGRSMTAIPLQNIDNWVQVYDLSVGFMTEMVGKLLENYSGEFLEFDKNNKSGPWRAYMRIRVCLDVSKPLKKERKVTMAGGEWNVVHFKYECIGIFCYLCGLLRHAVQFCVQRFALGEDTGERGWGSFLKAETRRGGVGRGGGNRCVTPFTPYTSIDGKKIS